MNDLQFLHAAVFFAGIIAGVLTLSFFVGANNPLEDLMEKGLVFVPTETAADSALLDHLEANELALYYNAEIEDGMWGVVDHENKLVAAGFTLRRAVERAIEKDESGTVSAVEATA